VVASFANRPFDRGYVLENAGIPDAEWREVLNSDAAAYGGAGVGNGDGPRRASAGRLEVLVPASGLVVLEAR
jgi:1,4-alpha-glucan branching enzyme